MSSRVTRAARLEAGRLEAARELCEEPRGRRAVPPDGLGLEVEKPHRRPPQRASLCVDRPALALVARHGLRGALVEAAHQPAKAPAFRRRPRGEERRSRGIESGEDGPAPAVAQQQCLLLPRGLPVSVDRLLRGVPGGVLPAGLLPRFHLTHQEHHRCVHVPRAHLKRLLPRLHHPRLPARDLAQRAKRPGSVELHGRELTQGLRLGRALGQFIALCSLLFDDELFDSLRGRARGGGQQRRRRTRRRRGGTSGGSSGNGMGGRGVCESRSRGQDLRRWHARSPLRMCCRDRSASGPLAVGLGSWMECLLGGNNQLCGNVCVE
mmetsp:Transcript_27786/g.62027  ORF Transcript_27786/g.62027 Transcript_27786/m.62027 type:complete len:322 (-) Transcript_27786:423-1388(-)